MRKLVVTHLLVKGSGFPASPRGARGSARRAVLRAVGGEGHGTGVGGVLRGRMRLSVRRGPRRTGLGPTRAGRRLLPAIRRFLVARSRAPQLRSELCPPSEQYSLHAQRASPNQGPDRARAPSLHLGQIMASMGQQDLAHAVNRPAAGSATAPVPSPLAAAVHERRALSQRPHKAPPASEQSALAPYRRRTRRRTGGRRKPSCASAAFTATRPTSAAGVSAPRTFRRRFSRAAGSGVSGDGVRRRRPAARRRRAPCARSARPRPRSPPRRRRARRPVRPSRARGAAPPGVRFRSAASAARAPAQPATTAASDSEFTVP